jgi:Osmosensitive K+ channel His kinase sensor domain
LEGRAFGAITIGTSAARFAGATIVRNAGHKSNKTRCSGTGLHTRPVKSISSYASGVGKSFRMFDEARRRKERGQDVVVGALQPQVPPEIGPILSSLEIVPTVDLEGVPVIDVPAILRRHSAGKLLVLVFRFLIVVVSVMPSDSESSSSEGDRD